jgi:general secretion pathway protein D
MSRMNRLGAPILVWVLVAGQFPLAGRTKKGDKFLGEGRAAEARGELDKALKDFESAVDEDPSDPTYLIAVRRARFEASQKHIKDGQKIRKEGRLADAIVEFQRAYAIDPSSPVSQEEIRRTREMMVREQRKAAGLPDEPESLKDIDTRGMTPAELSRKEQDIVIDSLQNVPELKPLNSKPIDLKMNGQKPRVLFETLGKIAGVNVLFDPDFDQQNSRPQSVELNNSTLQESLDYIALLTKSFWKPLSANAIFVTLDNTTKRRDFEEQVVKVFYLKNVTATTELQELLTTLRTVTDIQKIYQYTSQNALIVRCEADKMLLAEKIISDLDKPRSEVVVDVVVMQISTDHLRTLATQLFPGGLNVVGTFTPRASIASPSTTTSSSNTVTTSGTATSGTSSTTGTTVTTGSIPLSNLNKISSSDFTISGIPGAVLEAMLSDTGTKVLQSPQLRSVDNLKASLHIGDKVPTASGSFGSGVGSVGVGVSPLVQTQFTYIETGVNMDMTPKVHDADQVSLHIEIDIQQVTGYRDVGGIQQPIISQRKITQDIRTHDGEINLLGGLMQTQESVSKNGTPGLSQIPLLGRLFSYEQVEKSRNELLITLIPHIVRSPEITAANLRSVESGSVQNVKMSRSLPVARPVQATAPAVPPAGNPPATAPAIVPPAAAQPPATQPGAAQPAATQPNPAGAPRIVFLPSQLEMQVNSAMNVTLRAENVRDLASVQAQLKFDPAVLKIINVTSGDLVQQTGPALTPSKNILNDTGNATVSVIREAGAPGVNGAGGLITISLQAVGRGTTTVALQQFTLKTTAGVPVATNTPSLTVNVR